MSFDNILKRLASQELILPIFETQMMADKWPDSYTIKIDSGEYYGRPGGVPDGYFHPSTHALMGARELYYRFHPSTRDQIIQQPNTLQRQMTLAMGKSMHGIVQTMMQMTGLVTEENVEWEYTNEEHHLRGRIDFIVDHPSAGLVPVEAKTRNGFQFDKTDKILPSWDAQLSLGLDNYGADFGILLMMQTSWPFALKEFRVPRNAVLVEEIYQKFDLVREAVKNNTPPPPCCPLDSQTMQNCGARYMCWLSEDPKQRPGG